LKFLFIHQNFPGQYQHVVRHLADQPGNRVVFITQANENEMVGVTKVVYSTPRSPVGAPHIFVREFDDCVRNGFAVMEACRVLAAQGFKPDIVIGHNGWGEILFIKDIWPDVPLLGYFEFFYKAAGTDVGFDPEYPSHWSDGSRLRVKNAINLLGLDVVDWGQTPTEWQRSQYPDDRRGYLSVVHEGVDTEKAKPDPDAWIGIARLGLQITRQDEVITYVSRNLEPYRGFHVVMRTIPEILRRRPNARIILVGGDDVSYGQRAPDGMKYRALLLKELGDGIDLDRVHFLGRVSHRMFVNVLQVSSVHLYLTYPFVLSWSFLEAMSAGCLVLGSDTPSVTEVLHDGENGLLVDFFDQKGIADRIDEVLDHPDRMQALRDNARRTIVEQYDLNTVALPNYLKLIDRVLNGELKAGSA
jgi:glycosyltransferase involved in cell wall biosynthesis